MESHLFATDNVYNFEAKNTNCFFSRNMAHDLRNNLTWRFIIWKKETPNNCLVYLHRVHFKYTHHNYIVCVYMHIYLYGRKDIKVRYG